MKPLLRTLYFPSSICNTATVRVNVGLHVGAELRDPRPTCTVNEGMHRRYEGLSNDRI